jgi:hypothetical protein
MAKKSIFKIIREMVGREEDVVNYFSKLDLYRNIGYQSFDYSKPDFDLSKAVYYASVFKNKAGQDVGQKHVLGAAFAKPIINATTSFAFAESPSVMSEVENDNITFINKWLEENHDTFFDLVRFAMRDGVSYVKINDDLKPTLVSGDRVDIQVDPVSGELIGYNVEVVIKKDTDNINNIKYRTEYRKTSPHIKVLKIEDGKEQVIDEVTGEVDYFDMISFHNEKEPSFIYGISEFQNIYYLMSNYHAVLENAVKNNVFNSTVIPYIKGVPDVPSFMVANGTRQDDGTYKFSWDAQKVLIGGDTFDVGMMKPIENASEASELLNLLFWSICQTAETPEFVMGTAVQSSKASVSEQMPVMVRKAQRKQQQFERYIRELVETIAYKSGKELPEDYIIVFPDIIDDDMQLNMEIVKLLSEEGLISDRTKAMILGLDKYVSDLDEELEQAKEEKQEAEEQFAKSIKLANEPRKELEEKENERL